MAGFEPSQHMVPLRSNNIRMNQNRPKRTPKQLSSAASPDSLPASSGPCSPRIFDQGTRALKGYCTHTSTHRASPPNAPTRSSSLITADGSVLILLYSATPASDPLPHTATRIQQSGYRGTLPNPSDEFLSTPTTACAPTHPFATGTSLQE